MSGLAVAIMLWLYLVGAGCWLVDYNDVRRNPRWQIQALTTIFWPVFGTFALVAGTLAFVRARFVRA